MPGNTWKLILTITIVQPVCSVVPSGLVHFLCESMWCLTETKWFWLFAENNAFCFWWIHVELFFLWVLRPQDEVLVFCYFIWKISIIRLQSIAVFKRVLLFTVAIFTIFFSYLMKCFSILSYTTAVSSAKLIYWWPFVKWTWWLEIIFIYLEKWLGMEKSEATLTERNSCGCFNKGLLLALLSLSLYLIYSLTSVPQWHGIAQAQLQYEDRGCG